MEKDAPIKYEATSGDIAKKERACLGGAGTDELEAGVLDIVL